MKVQAIVVALLLALTPTIATQAPTLSEMANSKASVGNSVIAQFGHGFVETILATSDQGLDVPRDLEFHPAENRNDELWIVNRADDSAVILHETGTPQQHSEERLDSHRYHFMEEVSAIAFGAYDDEFDHQFATAQESRNTYNNQAEPNDFMGPALWPSSLDHFAVEHQNDGLLGSHTDMLHESPLGMGIAHDSGNAFWYFDGFYGHLVYYDFQEDHDTGMDDHSDGIVRRYSEVELTRTPDVPGHMILDDESGILYISDTGADRVLWVNTHDTSITTTDIMDDDSRLEELAEYSRITNVEWGILDSGISLPSGISLYEDTLFVGSNADNTISAYTLADDGKSATLVETVNTNADSLMGLEIGPDNALYYVDAEKNTVVRIDAWFDTDNDGIKDDVDNCLTVMNFDQADYDLDQIGDACDDDDDSDRVDDVVDTCQFSRVGFVSNPGTDFDNDGCEDAIEDDDDDNDGFNDSVDKCNYQTGYSYLGRQIGCVDTDSDGWADREDDFVNDPTQWLDLDEDGYGNSIDGTTPDSCITLYGNSTQDRYGCLDTDGDGYSNPDSAWTAQDGADAFPLDLTQWIDSDQDGFGDNQLGNQADDCTDQYGTSTIDRLGCLDTDGDGYSDINDDFVDDNTQWSDSDLDGYGDNPNGYNADECPLEYGNSTNGLIGCKDNDGDGWSDLEDMWPFDSLRWSDMDSDSYTDQENLTDTDDCPEVAGTSSIDRNGCIDSDGDGISDLNDFYPNDATRSEEETNFASWKIFASVTAIILLSLIAVFVIRRNKFTETVNFSSETSGLNEQIQDSDLPLPPGGLPPGWTIEQWRHYGEEWLRNQN